MADPTFRPRNSIKTRMILLFVMITALAIGAIGFLAASFIQEGAEEARVYSSQALQSQAERYLIQLSEGTARENDQILERVKSAALELSTYTASIFAMEQQLSGEPLWPVDQHLTLKSNGQYGNPTSDISSVFVPSTSRLSSEVIRDLELTGYLDLTFPSLFESDPNTVAMYFATPQDVVRYYPNINLSEVLPPDFAATGRPWYVSAVSEENLRGEPVWAPVYLDATGRGFVTTASAPVYDEQGDLLGVVGIDVTLVGITQNVEETPVLESGYSFLVDQAGIAIALPSRGYPDLLGREVEEGEFGTDLASSGTAFAGVLQAMLGGETGFQTLQVQDRELFIAYAPLESTGWSLGSVVEASEVLAEVDRLQQNLLATAQRLVVGRFLPVVVIVFGIVTVLGFIITNRLVNPIQQLAEAAHQIGRGQYDIVLPIDRTDEFGSLAQAFNLMATQVRELVGDLEFKVGERTEALERRALQLQTTADIAHLAAELLEPQDLLGRAVDLINNRFGFYHASIFTLDQTGGWAELTASTGEAGKSLLEKHHRLAVGSPSIVGWVSANRLPRVANDVEQDPFHFKNPQLPGTRAEMAVPIMIGERLLGILDVQATELNAFQDPDVQATQAIAGELAIALDNARLMLEQREQLAEVETRYRSSARASWDQLARIGLPGAIRFGPPLEDGEIADLSSKLSSEAVLSGQTMLSPEGREVVVPISVRGEVIATITARKNPGESPWDRDDMDMMEAIAGQAGLALETARQYSEEQRRVSELEVLNRISQAASQLLEPHTLFRVIHRQINLVLGSTDMLLVNYDMDSQTMQFPYYTERDKPFDIPTLPLGQDPVSTVIRTQQPLLHSLDPSRSKVDTRSPLSWLGVPLQSGENVLGVLAVQDFQRTYRYSEDDVAFLTTVASQVATAIQNINLLEQVQRTSRRERLVHAITSKVRRSPDVKTVLETTARELSRALNASKTSIRLGERERAAKSMLTQSPERNQDDEEAGAEDLEP